MRLRWFFLIIGLIISSTRFLNAQEPYEIALKLHQQLHYGEFTEAKSSMLLLKRKMRTSLIDPKISTFTEYIRWCNEIGIDIVVKDEAILFAQMLETAYQDNTDYLIKHSEPIVRELCDLQEGYLADIFFKSISPILPVEKRLDLQYHIAWAYNYSEAPYNAWYKFRECADSYKILGDHEKEYARCLNGIAYVNRFIGQEEDAIELYKVIGEIYKSEFGEKSVEYAINLDNIGRCMLTCYDNPEEALAYMEAAYEIFKEYPEQSLHLSICMNNIACCYGKLGDDEKELEMLLRTKEINPDANILISNLGRVYERLGNNAAAMEYYDSLPEYYLQSLAAPDYALNCAKRNDIAGFIEYEGYYLDYRKRVMRQNFEEMIGSDRELYTTRQWDCNQDSLFRIGSKIGNEAIARLCYDCLLFQKSVSLSCDRSIESLIASTTSDSLRNMYNKLINIKESGNVDRDSYETQERDFLKMLAKESDYTTFLDITWSDIADKLSDREVAIEFHVADAHDENKIYAVVLSKHLIKLLCLGSVLNKEDIENIWHPLEPYTGAADKVYFSPDGILNTLPLEAYAGTVTGKKLYRLSSTREIVLDYATQGKDTYIYGGLKYDTSIDTLRADAAKYSNGKRSLTLSDFTSLRGAVAELEYLPGSAKEAGMIADLVSSHTPSPLGEPFLFSGSKGTEASFKNLSGMRPKVIHIGTHGFFMPKKEGLLASSEAKIDDALRRSGLMLAGVDTYATAEEGLEDGILTAQEISILDFRGLDLVVLSACESGLGDVSSDGVIGLQRGFKKAGAKSILMSLWKVDDEATGVLMSEFYKHWINGRSKHDSLELAKETVKQHTDKGWDNPVFWSAFILLDGMD